MDQAVDERVQNIFLLVEVVAFTAVVVVDGDHTILVNQNACIKNACTCGFKMPVLKMPVHVDSIFNMCIGNSTMYTQLTHTHLYSIDSNIQAFHKDKLIGGHSGGLPLCQEYLLIMRRLTALEDTY